MERGRRLVRGEKRKNPGRAGRRLELLYPDGRHLRTGYGRNYSGKSSEKRGKVSGGEGVWE